MIPIMIKVTKVISDGKVEDVWINASFVESISPHKAGSEITFSSNKYGMTVYHAPDAVAAMIRDALAGLERTA